MPSLTPATPISAPTLTAPTSAFCLSWTTRTGSPRVQVAAKPSADLTLDRAAVHRGDRAALHDDRLHAVLALHRHLAVQGVLAQELAGGVAAGLALVLAVGRRGRGRRRRRFRQPGLESDRLQRGGLVGEVGRDGRRGGGRAGTAGGQAEQGGQAERAEGQRHAGTCHGGTSCAASARPGSGHCSGWVRKRDGEPGAALGRVARPRSCRRAGPPGGPPGPAPDRCRPCGCPRYRWCSAPRSNATARSSSVKPGPPSRTSSTPAPAPAADRQHQRRALRHDPQRVLAAARRPPAGSGPGRSAPRPAPRAARPAARGPSGGAARRPRLGRAAGSARPGRPPTTSSGKSAASSRASTSRSAISRSSRSASASMVCPAFGAPSAPTTPSASASAYPRMVVSGVRSSCETDSRNSRCRPSLVWQGGGEVVERGGQLGRLGRRRCRPAGSTGRRRRAGRPRPRPRADRPGQPNRASSAPASTPAEQPGEQRRATGRPSRPARGAGARPAG